MPLSPSITHEPFWHPSEKFLRMEEHVNTMPVQRAGPTLEMTNLEADRWKLCKTRIEYDLQVLRVAKPKLSSWESAHYHQKLLHRQQAWENSFRGAETFLNGNAAFVCNHKIELVIQEVISFQQRWSKSLGIRPEGLAPWHCSVWDGVGAFFLMGPLGHWDSVFMALG